MAVQINEVIIRAVVDPRPSTGTASQPACPPGATTGESELMERILDIIREKQER